MISRICALGWKFFIFCHFSKKCDETPTKNEKIGKKINFSKNDEDR